MNNKFKKEIKKEEKNCQKRLHTGLNLCLFI